MIGAIKVKRGSIVLTWYLMIFLKLELLPFYEHNMRTNIAIPFYFIAIKQLWYKQKTTLNCTSKSYFMCFIEVGYICSERRLKCATQSIHLLQIVSLVFIRGYSLCHFFKVSTRPSTVLPRAVKWYLIHKRLCISWIDNVWKLYYSLIWNAGNLFIFYSSAIIT